MRRTRLVRLAILGAIGFSVGWAIAAVLIFTGGYFAWWGFFFGGAVGGLTLGLAMGDSKRAALLTVGGFGGFGLGFYLSTNVALLLNAPQFAYFGPAGGMLGGAMFGLSLGSWREPAVLALAGLVGFGIGEAVTAALQPLLLGPALWEEKSTAVVNTLGALQQLSPELATPQGFPLWRLALDEVVRGAVGGASLGAAVGYLESRRPAFSGVR
jgi:hypothetical protein